MKIYYNYVNFKFFLFGVNNFLMYQASITPRINVSTKYTTILNEYMPQQVAKVVEHFENPDEPLDEDSNAFKTLQTLKKFDNTFIDFVVGLFGKIKVVVKDKEVDVKSTLLNLSNVEYRDMEFSADDLKVYFRLFRSANWSDFTSSSQSKNKYNCAVPLLLHAQRLYNDIPYSYWMKEGKNKTILGKSLAALADLKPIEFEDIYDLRVKMVTGKSQGVEKVFPFSAYKANKTGNDEFDELPKLYKMMLGQIWIFNSQCRNENMILDWWNWDNIPDPMDGRKEQKITLKSTYVNKEVDDLI